MAPGSGGEAIGRPADAASREDGVSDSGQPPKRTSERRWPNARVCSAMPDSPRRFPPPWTVEETAPCFIVRDANGQALAFVYCEDEPGRRAAAARPRPY